MAAIIKHDEYHFLQAPVSMFRNDTAVTASRAVLKSMQVFLQPEAFKKHMQVNQPKDISHFHIVGINYKKTDAAIRGLFAINVRAFHLQQDRSVWFCAGCGSINEPVMQCRPRQSPGIQRTGLSQIRRRRRKASLPCWYRA
jgi:hypothetical protein